MSTAASASTARAPVRAASTAPRCMAAIWSALHAQRVTHGPGEADRAAVPAGSNPDAAPGEPGAAQIPTVRTHRNRHDSHSRSIGPDGTSTRPLRHPPIGAGTASLRRAGDREQPPRPSPVCAVIRAWLNRSGQRAPGFGPGQQPVVTDPPRVDPDAGTLGREHAPGAVRLELRSRPTEHLRPPDRRRLNAEWPPRRCAPRPPGRRSDHRTARAVSDRHRCQVAPDPGCGSH